MRGLPIAYYLRGNVSAGDPSAYDIDVKTLMGYQEQVAKAPVP